MAATDEPNPRIFYHGTRADLKPGDLIEAGYSSNYGARKQASWVYLTGALDAAVWGAGLAAGGGRGRIYMVEPTGPIEDDPNLTDKKFPGNEARSHAGGHGEDRSELRCYCSRASLRVAAEVADFLATVRHLDLGERLGPPRRTGPEPALTGRSAHAGTGSSATRSHSRCAECDSSTGWSATLP